MIKSERGSVTVFTLSACLLMSFILVGIFMGSQNKVINQKKQLKSIENSYKENSDDEKMSQLYEEAMKNDPSNIEADLKITTAEELKDFATRVNNGENFSGKTVVLMNDIDLASVCSSTIGSWTPIGNSTAKTFKGTFNGRNYTISNLFIKTKESNQGLFGVNSGKIKNIKMNNSSVYAQVDTSTFEGANYSIICGLNLTGGEITSCKNLNGSINSDYAITYIGGIVGDNKGTISRCFNNAKVSGYDVTGGIAGRSYNAKIERCYNTAAIGANTNVGGIVGNNTLSEVTNCYNTSTSGAGGGVAGGIIGVFYSGKLENCYALGKISGSGWIGGIVGNDKTSFGSISNCYYLEGIASGGVGTSGTNSTTAEDKTGSVEVKTSSELKELYKTLGTEFKKDIGSTNDGYPILSWQ